MAQWYKLVTIDVGSIPRREIKYFYFFTLVTRQSAALRSATQHAISRAVESRECSVLTLGSLCLPY